LQNISGTDAAPWWQKLAADLSKLLGHQGFLKMEKISKVSEELVFGLVEL
jgi:hypothetical protein